ncbi:hypothetical protein AWM70_03205 [Paenibacillus yonginensis]|uniref:RNA polymerase sigma factor 70 region 4 type 2 domain-containing protein n=1 Tax=Paenibacillus yonginensis TaxID=1462996 RepID=A0A1B1MWZ2_9BACL|nr:sigma factor-like helix-turn-helix DNA-binding protein [Paenibacillus yonginensis]ANS73702.1 hypothetical protein AWM70_03205 [Paenibacillus yonginensis]
MSEKMWLDMLPLKTSYEQTLELLEQLRLERGAEHPDYKMLGEMISDCRYVLEWLNSGRRPGNRRGIERRAAYQREQLMDPIKMQIFVSPPAAGSSSRITDSERDRLEQALALLSSREQECYTLAHGCCYSLSEIADMLGISKSSAALYVRRAQKKVTEWIGQEGQESKKSRS